MYLVVSPEARSGQRTARSRQMLLLKRVFRCTSTRSANLPGLCSTTRRAELISRIGTYVQTVVAHLAAAARGRYFSDILQRTCADASVLYFHVDALTRFRGSAVHTTLTVLIDDGGEKAAG